MYSIQNRHIAFLLTEWQWQIIVQKTHRIDGNQDPYLSSLIPVIVLFLYD